MTTAALLLAMALGSVQAAAPAAGTPAKSPAAANPDDLLEAVRKGDLAAVQGRARRRRSGRHAVPLRAHRALVRGGARQRRDREAAARARRRPRQEGLLLRRDAVQLGRQRGPRRDGPAADRQGRAGRAGALLERRPREGNAELVALALEKTKPSADDLAIALADAQEGQARDASSSSSGRPARCRRPPPTSRSTPRRSPATPAPTATSAAASCASSVREGKLVCVNCNQPGIVLGALDAVTFRGAGTAAAEARVLASRKARPTGFVLDFGDRQVPTSARADEASKEKP